MYCLFCHKGLGPRKVCPTCRTGFVKWISEHTNIKWPLAAHKVLATVPFTNNEMPKWNGRSWPGFYGSDDKWSIPENYYVTDEAIRWDNAHEVLLELLRGRGIDLSSHVQVQVQA